MASNIPITDGPVFVGSETEPANEEQPVYKATSGDDAKKLVRTNAAGKIDSSLLGSGSGITGAGVSGDFAIFDSVSSITNTLNGVKIQTPATDKIQFVNSNGTFLNMAADGKFGFGRAAPIHEIDIAKDSDANMIIESHNSGVSSSYLGRNSNGTIATPTATPNNRRLVGLFGHGYDSADWLLGGGIAIEADELWSVGNNGTRMEFSLTPIGSSSTLVKATLLGSGNFGLGILDPQTNFHLQENNADTVPAQEIEQLGSGDAGLQFSIVGDAFAIGIDNSDDRFKISYAASAGAAVLGTNDKFIIHSAGIIIPDGIFNITNKSGTETLSLTGYGAIGNELDFHQANGTEAAPTATLNTNILSQIRGYGRDDSADTLGLSFQFIATENWGAAAHGSGFKWQLKPTGTTGINPVMWLVDQDDEGPGLGLGNDPLLIDPQKVIAGAVTLNGTVFHISDNDHSAHMIIEGTAATLHLIDEDAGVDDKWMTFGTTGGLTNLQVLNDAGLVIGTAMQILHSTRDVTFGGGNVFVTNGMVAIGHATPTETVDILGNMLLTHIAAEDDDHALEIIVNAAGFADVKGLDIDYITGAVAAGEDDEAILIQFDESLATGGDVQGVEVLTTPGLADITALEAGALVNPVKQQSGVFADMDAALVLAIDRLTEFTTIGVDIAMFVANGDTVTIENDDKFEEISWILDTVASGAGIKPTFRFSTGSGTWASFVPTDGTNGMRNNGTMAWESDNILTWAAGASGRFLIEITRTRVTVMTVPIESIVQIAVTVDYEWNKFGDVKIRNLGAGTKFPENLLGHLQVIRWAKYT